MKAMILVAGRGKRLGNLTKETPKPLLHVAGRPLLEYTLKHLKQIGITQVVLNPSYQGQKIIDHFGDGSQFGVSIEYSVEEDCLGTAGGVRAALPLIEGRSTLILYGDNYYRCDFRKLIRQHLYKETGWGSTVCTLGLQQVYPWEYPASIVAFNENQLVTEFTEKPAEPPWDYCYRFGGLMMLNPSAMESIPERTFCDFGYDVFPQWLRFDKKIGTTLYEHDAIVDIGTPKGYSIANELAKNGDPP